MGLIRCSMLAGSLSPGRRCTPVGPGRVRSGHAGPPPLPPLRRGPAAALPPSPCAWGASAAAGMCVACTARDSTACGGSSTKGAPVPAGSPPSVRARGTSGASMSSTLVGRKRPWRGENPAASSRSSPALPVPPTGAPAALLLPNGLAEATPRAPSLGLSTSSTQATASLSALGGSKALRALGPPPNPPPLFRRGGGSPVWCCGCRAAAGCVGRGGEGVGYLHHTSQHWLHRQQ